MAKIKIKCKVCEKEIEVIRSTFDKSSSMKSSCCSFECLKRTCEYREKRKNADKIRTSKIRESNGFEQNGMKSKITRAKNFLDLFCISYEGLNDKQLLELWKKEYSEKAEHSQKIRIGRLKKHGNLQSLKASDRARIVKGSCKKLHMPYRDDFTEDEIKSITKKAYENFKVSNTFAWKLKHVLRYWSIDNANSLDEKRVNELYSEYMSNRFCRESIENSKNGYTRSEKGWYVMTNQDGYKFFYRSSWEKKVFEALDCLVGSKSISHVCTPERIPYIFEEIQRHYYPDMSFVKLDGTTIVLEIKPLSKVDDAINVKKISAAKTSLGNNFQVLTEVEIFQNELIQILEKL